MVILKDLMGLFMDFEFMEKLKIADEEEVKELIRKI